MVLLSPQIKKGGWFCCCDRLKRAGGSTVATDKKGRVVLLS